ncbi:MAG: elongation factor G, partial [Spirochaetaceae bacterium]|nr:elongation factor G [Spirochaetaceae bacterium]
ALAEEDPSLRWREDPQTGRIELSGMGELHLEIAVERLARERGARIRAGAPRVAYRESLAGEAVAREDFDRDLGGERARARVGLRLGPGESGAFSGTPSVRRSPRATSKPLAAARKRP